MSEDITFTVYGLEIDKGDVDADIFVQKFQKFLKGLHEADKIENASQKWRYVISDLKHSSAVARLKETAKSNDVEKTASAIETYYKVVDSVYNGSTNFDEEHLKLIKSIKDLTMGAGDKFSHAEINKGNDNIIRIDDFLKKRAIDIETSITKKLKLPSLYKGIAIGEFDGILKEVDARGNIVKGILILTAGEVQLEYTLKQQDIESVRDNFNKRAIVKGMAHYDGKNPLPVRIDVKSIKPIIPNKDGLNKWRGAFKDADENIEDLEW